jgi:hypothetical protein
VGRPRGTVDERRPGVWRLRAEGAPDPVTGERQRMTKTVYVKGKRQAQQELAKLLTDLGAKPRRAGTRSKSVADACDAWLTMFHALVAAGKKSPASGRRFREVVEWYVIPALGDRSLRDLTNFSSGIAPHGPQTSRWSSAPSRSPVNPRQKCTGTPTPRGTPNSTSSQPCVSPSPCR